LNWFQMVWRERPAPHGHARPRLPLRRPGGPQSAGRRARAARLPAPPGEAHGLARGRQARDLIVLNQNLTTIPLDDISKTDVLVNDGRRPRRVARPGVL